MPQSILTYIFGAIIQASTEEAPFVGFRLPRITFCAANCVQNITACEKSTSFIVHATDLK